MITNAIPGITNINAFVNTATAKGIAASKEQTADFQKTLNNANTQKQAAQVATSTAKTLTATAASNKAGTLAATYEQANTPRQTENISKQDNMTKNADSTDDTKALQSQNADEKNVNVKEVTDNVAEAPEEVTEEIAEETEVSEVLITINENPGEDGSMIGVIDDALSALEQAMLDDSRELMQQLADQLGVDIEDIESAMATLGLTNVAILEPTNLTQIIGQVTGANDVMAIVTNADLYLNVQNMQDAVDTTRQNLMEEFNLSEEDLSSALEDFSENLAQQSSENQVQAVPVENTNTEENPIIIEQPQNYIDSEAVRLDLTNNAGIVKEIAVEQEEEAPVTEVSEEIEKPDFSLQVEEPVQEQRNVKENNANNNSNNNNGNSNTHENNLEGSVYNQVMNQISSSLSEVVETESYGQMARANTQEIMDQITEFIKMNVKADSTTMEMQLHPASLGNVNVIIEAAKDGNVIAKFLTQNEDVKAAIESQIQQLQDKLNEQGVKVTAVEVTVNAGAFDQTLNDSQSQRQDDQDAQNSIRKPMRRIRLDDLSMEELDEIDEADQLTAEMMAINGNSVDFSA
ncbi:flagellar hook-length control protein FliK [Butyrivibrio sp. AE3004]|uniref:flagellar hook-length control protein FliK n=1 Tax=Butyrivibrio sp. AE3004 TaxID=1506994 RepID=UPI000493D805|nr:flagellar hook-length control protein FliK [Butyrivibrio sp. AE3004]